MKNYLFALVLIFTLIGCSKPLPESRQAYLGEWRGEGVVLNIMPDGMVDYQRTQGSASTSIKAPIKRFEGDDLVVGVLFMATTFIVNEPPNYSDGIWVMTVDGIKLVKAPNAR